MAELYPYAWRTRLKPASFRGAQFHVETDSQSGGRRVALHEYPKKNQPYAEDMGRHATSHAIEGYLIMGPTNLDYTGPRDALIRALDADGPGQLVHPSLGPMSVMCERYTVIETRDKGGYCKFDMVFIEAGDGDTSSTEDTQISSNGAAGNAEKAASTQLDTALKSFSDSWRSVGGTLAQDAVIAQWKTLFPSAGTVATLTSSDSPWRS